jgi:hypothetical protein
MKTITACLLAFLVMMLNAAALGQVTSTECMNRSARITVPGGITVTAPLYDCKDTVPCGYVLTYNPPGTTCVAETGFCCIQELEQAYTQSWICTQGTCKGQTKIYVGFSVLVNVTTKCKAGRCEAPDVAQ